jgi:hypothetical protein
MADDAGGRRWGPLEVLERLGGGPSGEVFRARPAAGGQVVALRLLPAGTGTDSARAAAFVERGQRLAGIEHPHLVRVLGAGVHGGRAGRIMEFVDGMAMDRLVGEQGPLAPQELIAIGTALCRALEALHAAGVVHGDVRARNVVRARGLRVVLMDPGTEPLPTRGAAASVPLSAGAPAYFAAPELLRGEPSTPASDIYALGALLHLLATGELPVGGADLIALRAAHEKGAGRPVGKLRRDLPPALAATIDRALARDPGARFAGAEEMERALLGEAVAPPPADLEARLRRARAGGPSWTWLAIAAAAVAGAAGIWPLMRGEAAGPSPPEPPGAEVAAAAVPGAPALDARLFRSGLVRDEPLGESSQAEAGDELYLMLVPAEEQYLYVLHRSADGRLAALLPDAAGAAVARIPAGRRVRVPGPVEGRIVTWRAGPGGVEFFLVLGAREPIPLLDAALVGRTVENPLLPEGLAGRYFEEQDLPPDVSRRSFAVAVRER